MPRTQSESVPASMQQTSATITGLTDAFCREHLNDEYATLSRQLAAALARKRPSPLAGGKPNIRYHRSRGCQSQAVRFPAA